MFWRYSDYYWFKPFIVSIVYMKPHVGKSLYYKLSLLVIYDFLARGLIIDTNFQMRLAIIKWAKRCFCYFRPVLFYVRIGKHIIYINNRPLAITQKILTGNILNEWNVNKFMSVHLLDLWSLNRYRQPSFQPIIVAPCFYR